MKRVLVLSPHPDDEAIGCGGTIRLHVQRGDHVTVVFLTSGERGIRGQEPCKAAAVREREAQAAARILGYPQIEFWRAPDGRLKVSVALLRKMRQVLRTLKPDIIYATHAREMHPDHRAAARLVRAALAGRKSMPQVRSYEVWTPLQQIDHIEDITMQLKTKIAAVRAHRSQCAIMRFDEASRALARYRGEMHSWPGGPYAEVFQTS